MLLSENLSVLAITETWLVESIGTPFVDVDGFYFYRRDVAGDVRKHGVGVRSIALTFSRFMFPAGRHT